MHGDPRVVNASLPDSIPIEQGAILADAVSTPYHAIRFVGEMKPAESVLIAGCGGLGSME